MRFSVLNVIKSSAPVILLILALPLVAQRAEVSEQQDNSAQLMFVPPNTETIRPTPSDGHQPHNRLEGYFALAGFALITVLCRKR